MEGTVGVKKCPKCGSVWYTALVKCAFCGIEGEELPVPVSPSRLAIDRPGPSGAPAEVPKAPSEVKSVEAPPAGAEPAKVPPPAPPPTSAQNLPDHPVSVESENKKAPEPSTVILPVEDKLIAGREPQGELSSSAQKAPSNGPTAAPQSAKPIARNPLSIGPRPDPELSAPPAPRIPSATVPLVYGWLSILAWLLLPALVYLGAHRIPQILGLLAWAALAPFAPFAWFSGQRYLDRCRELGFRPVTSARTGKILGIVSTFILLFEASLLAVLIAIIRLTGQLSGQLPNPFGK